MINATVVGGLVGALARHMGRIAGVHGLSAKLMAPDEIMDPFSAALVGTIVEWFSKRGKIPQAHLRKVLLLAIAARGAYEALEYWYGIRATPISAPHPYGSLKDIVTFGVTLGVHYWLQRKEESG